MATHDLDLIRRTNHRTLELNHGRIVYDSSEPSMDERGAPQASSVGQPPASPLNAGGVA